MILLDDTTLRKLQKIELELLFEVDRICKVCDIHYNIIAGTLLGAVRHKGFIPWDDDADVGMLRPEYEKFREACKTELDTTRFYFQDHRSTDGYRWGYGKLRRKGTLFMREFQEHMPYEQGVFIDIFPLDGVPDNYILRYFHNLECTIIRKTLWSAVGRKSEKKPILKNLYRLIYKIHPDVVFVIYHQLIIKSNRKSTKMVRKLMYPTPNKVYGYYRYWYEQSVDYEFEQHTFKGIKQFHEYLSFKYGDFMTLPPMNQRKVHPVSSLILAEGELANEQYNVSD